MILTDLDRSKLDNSNDEIFYNNPKFVNHLDQNFRNRLTKLYKEEIPFSSTILDLMSSWISHLPKDITYNKVIGHGLNMSELKSNKRLDQYWVQNLNTNFILPLESNTIDVILITAGWQYLQYPEYIASELKRLISPEGKIIISFSNRAFWHKTPRLWRLGNYQDHISYISSILVNEGWTSPRSIIENFPSTGLSRLFKYSSDPFYCVISKPN